MRLASLIFALAPALVPGWILTTPSRPRRPAAASKLLSSREAVEEEFTILNFEVMMRAKSTARARLKLLQSGADGDGTDADGGDGATESASALAERGALLQRARRGREAERLYLTALERDIKCAAAWYRFGTLLHAHQHGGLATDDVSFGIRMIETFSENSGHS